MGRGSYQVPNSQAERSAGVEGLLGSLLAELFLSDLCGELSGGIVRRVMNDSLWERRGVSKVDPAEWSYEQRRF